MENTLSKDEVIREDVVNAAHELFRKFGFKKTTMEDIADAAGKGKSTLYYYFKNKHEVFEAVIIEESQQFMRRLRESVFVKEGLRTQLLTYFHTKIDLVQEMTVYFTALHDYINSDFKRFNNIINKSMHHEQDIIRFVLNQANTNGELQDWANGKKEDLVNILILQSRAAVLMAEMSGNFTAAKEDANLLVNTLLHGLSK